MSGTINVTVSSVIWYVRDIVDANNAAGGDGRSTDAFETLTAAQAASGIGHFIFVFTGNTVAVPLTDGIVLKDGQKLHGQGVGLSVPGFANIVAAGVQPRINNALGDAVSLPATAGARNNVEIRGLDLQSSANAVDVTSTGANTVSVTISDNTVRGAGTEGIDLNAGSTGLFSATVQTNTIAATGNGFDARRTAAGALQVAFNTNTVVSGATAIVIDGSGGGTTTITGFNGNTVSGNTAGAGIVVTTAVFDSTPGGSFDQVAGGATAVGLSGNGVGTSGVVLNNVAGDLAFTDLDVFSSGGPAFFLSGAGAFTGAAGTRVTVPANVSILDATGGAAVDVSGATVDLRLNTLNSAASPTNGVRLVNVFDGGGTDARFSAPSGSNITTAAGIDFEVSGGNAGISYAGGINNSVSRAVSISTWAGDDATDDMLFSGPINDLGTGILVNGNSGSRAITFSGSLTINPASGNIGFSATSNTNTGGLQVTGSNSTVTTTNAAALNVTSTTIGAGGLTFRTLSANGGPSGVILSSTGSLGGLSVTGNAGPGTGGTIQNTTGAGISLTNTRAAFQLLNLSNTGGHGLEATSVTNFSYQDASLINVGSGNEEQGMKITNLLGTSLIEDVSLDDIAEDGIQVRQTATDDGTADADHTAAKRPGPQGRVRRSGHRDPDRPGVEHTILVDDSDFAINSNAVLGVAIAHRGDPYRQPHRDGAEQHVQLCRAFGSGSIQALGGGSGNATYWSTTTQSTPRSSPAS